MRNIFRFNLFLTLGIMSLLLNCKPATSTLKVEDGDDASATDLIISGATTILEKGFSATSGSFKSKKGLVGLVPGGSEGYDALELVGGGSVGAGYQVLKSSASYYGTRALGAVSSASSSLAGSTAVKAIGGLAAKGNLATGVFMSVGNQAAANYGVHPAQIEEDLRREALIKGIPAFPQDATIGPQQPMPPVGTVSLDGTKVYSEPYLPWNNNYWADR